MHLSKFSGRVLPALLLSLSASTACNSAGNFGSKQGKGLGSGQATNNKAPPGGNATQSPADTQVKSGLPCDVYAVLAKNCASCHGAEPEFGAVGTLVTWDGLDKADSKGSGKKVRDLLLDRVRGIGSIMPPPPATALTAADISTLENWLKAGANKSGDSCEAIAEHEHSHETPQLSCTPDQKMRPAAPYAIKPDAPLNEYVCYGFDVDNANRRQITELAPFIDNSKILHHILLFEAPQSYPSTPQRCGMTGSGQWKLVTGWAPGGKAVTYPEDAGFPQSKGVTHYVMQLHYNLSQKLPDQKDGSGFDFCTTDKLRKYDASVVAFGGLTINIPPKTPNYVLECSYQLPSQFKTVTFLGGSPHMHERGKSASLSLKRAGSADTINLINVPNYSYHDQAVLPINQQASAGDTVTTRCGYSNQSNFAVTFGEKTEDEMCFNFVGYYPAVPDQMLGNFPIFNWLSPSIFASCRRAE